MNLTKESVAAISKKFNEQTFKIIEKLDQDDIDKTQILEEWVRTQISDMVEALGGSSEILLVVKKIVEEMEGRES